MNDTMKFPDKIVLWGIVGCGRIASDFVKAMRYSTTENQICAVACTDSALRARQFCAQNDLSADDGKISCYGSHMELFLDSNIDVVYVASLNHQHREDVLRALDAGKHVLCEKPMGVNAREVREMVEKARNRGKFLMEGYWTRCFPLWREIKEKRMAELGKLDMVQADFGFTVKAKYFRVASASDEVIHGGEGYLMASGCYSVMTAQFVFDDQEPVEVLAHGDKRGAGERGWDLWANILLRYPGGQLARLFYSGQHRTPGSLSIFGTEANIRIPGYFWTPVEAVVEQYNDTRRADTLRRHVLRHPLPEFDAAQFYYPHTVGLCYQIDHVAQCIREGKTESPLMSLEHSIRVAKILDQIRHQLGVVYPQDDERRQQ